MCSYQRAPDLPRRAHCAWWRRGIEPCPARHTRVCLRGPSLRRAIHHAHPSALFRQIGRVCHLWSSSSRSEKPRSRSRSSDSPSRRLHPRFASSVFVGEYASATGLRSEANPPNRVCPSHSARHSASRPVPHAIPCLWGSRRNCPDSSLPPISGRKLTVFRFRRSPRPIACPKGRTVGANGAGVVGGSENGLFLRVAKRPAFKRQFKAVLRPKSGCMGVRIGPYGKANPEVCQSESGSMTKPLGR